MKNSDKMILGYIVGGLLVIIIAPSIIYFVTMLLDKIYRIEIFHDHILQLAIVIPLMIIGLLFGISSIVYQNVIGKGGPVEISNIEISPKTQNLVTSGPYRITRNPMLFGTFLMYFAFALIINSISAVFLIIILVVFMLTFVVRKEEERLLKDFGNQYIQYRNMTSMIIPWFPKKR